MRKLALAGALILSGCAPHFDPVEYSRLAYARVAIEEMLPRCPLLIGPLVHDYVWEPLAQGREQARYRIYGSHVEHMFEEVKSQARGLLDTIDQQQGTVSKAYCVAKLQALHNSIDRMQGAIAALESVTPSF